MPDTFLQAVRINTMMQAIIDPREADGALLWTDRIPQVQAFDDEIMARFLGRVQIADLIADDQAAVTYTTGKITFESSTAPKIKHGQAMTESLIRQLRMLQASGNLRGDNGIFLMREASILASLKRGIAQRKEALRIAMLTDTFAYNRLGIVIASATWGMPADLKVTTSVAWTLPATATPVTDIQTLIRLGQVRYGATFTRLTMSRQAFDYMIATTEFQNKAKPFLATGIGFTNLSTQDTASMEALAVRVIGNGVSIELYDKRYWQQDAAGVVTSANYHPINKVILTDPSNDGNGDVWDFAQGEVIEPVVAAALGGGGWGPMPNGATYGPIGYATGAADLNPPNITYWGVDRGFPRKHLLQSNAVMTVGSFTDSIPYAEPF